ncbi:MAG: hypothetical protein HXX13_14840 [Bacteroidetes bacterium]|nr:hypothetical protein [Bacteroidota bacterium]
MISLLTCLSWALLTSFAANLTNSITSISPWYYLIPASAIGFFFYYRVTRNPKAKKKPDKSPGDSTEFKEIVEFNRYAGGHPAINEVIVPCVVHLTPGMLQICKYADAAMMDVTIVGEIPLKSINSMRVVDVFTMKKKMTSENWNGSNKYFNGLYDRRATEVAFLVIEWLNDSVHQSTYLCIEDAFAMEKAIKKRNAVIYKARHQALQFA